MNLPAERLQTTLELFATGVALKQQALRRVMTPTERALAMHATERIEALGGNRGKPLCQELAALFVS